VRLKISLLKARISDQLTSTLETDDFDPGELLNDWAMGKPKAVTSVKDLLASTGRTLDAITASVLVAGLERFERIDRMIIIAESRRNAILREIDRHRGLFGPAPRGAVRQIEARALVSKEKGV